MRKILLPILLFIFSCENNDIESKKKKLDILKNTLVETYSEIEILEKEIILLDSTYIQKNYRPISETHLGSVPKQVF